jgi:hypothetical protein
MDNSNSPFDSYRLSVLLAERWQENVEVYFTKCLATGYSGAMVCQVEIHESQSKVSFAVVKVAGDGKNSDLEREFDAMDIIRKEWPAENIPDHCVLFVDSELVNGRPNAAVLVTSFAHPMETKISTLRELLNTDMARGIVAIEKTVQFYNLLLLNQSERNSFPICARNYLLEMFGEGLSQKLLSCDWMAWSGISPECSNLIIGDHVLPNAAYVLNNPDIWENEVFSAPRVLLHGDLNIDNLIILPDGRFVFIDFEKSRRGIVYWDISFLIMWIAQFTLLDGKELHISDLKNLILRVAQPLEPDEKFELGKLGCKMEPFAGFASNFLFPLGTSADNLSPSLPGPNRRKAASLGIAAAALARAYYQFRAAANNLGSHDLALSQRLNGLFFYALSCAALKRGEFLKPQVGGRSQNLMEIEKNITSAGDCDFKVVEMLQSALELPIQSKNEKSPAIYVKLVFEVPLDLRHYQLKGWERITNHGPWGYLSKLNISSDSRVRKATENILLWDLSENGPQPLVFCLDKSVLSETWNIVYKSFQLSLCEIDMIPLARGAAMIGFLFKRGACLVGDYLKWISYRNFGKLNLVPDRTHADRKHSALTIGGLRHELIKAIQEDRYPQLDAVGTSRSDMDFPKVFQHLMWPDLDIDLRSLDGSVQGQALAMLATLSRLRTGYPKDGPESYDSWKHRQSEKSLYCISKKAFTLVSDPELEFNRQSKPFVFMQSNYMLWVMAREIVRKSKESGDVLLKCIDEDLRKEIFKRCLQFHLKQEQVS